MWEILRKRKQWANNSQGTENAFNSKSYSDYGCFLTSATYNDQ